MKRLCVLLLAVSVLLCGCSGKPLSVGSDRVVLREGTKFVIDVENGTVTEGEEVYRFSVEGNRVTIAYPNGGTYTWETDGSIGQGGGSGDYDDSRYVSGAVLADILVGEQLQNAGTNIGMVICGLVCLVIGLWGALLPNSVLYLRHGWRYRHLEPSDIALTVTRLGGVLTSIFGAIAFLAGL